jgi:hypothetical protein
MTYLQPGGSSAPTARIRILGCDPPPPPPRRGINRALVAACAAAAGLGIVAAVTGRHLLAEPVAQPQAAPEVVGVGVQALVGAQPPRHRPVVRRALRATVAPVDLQAAARTERRFAVARVPAGVGTAARPTAPAPVPAPATAPAGDTASAPAPAAPAARAVRAEAAPVRDAVTRPDLPPDPTDPNTRIDQP